MKTMSERFRTLLRTVNFARHAAMFCWLACAARSAQADTITWANSAGNTNWMAGASWVGGSVPGTVDVAIFPRAVPVAQPTLNASVGIDALLLSSGGWPPDCWTLSGTGTLTLGASPGTASGYGLEIQGFNPRIYPDIVLGGPQSWAFTETSGSPDVYLYGTLSGTGPLTIRQPISTWYCIAWFLQNTTAPTFTGGLNVTCGKMQWDLLLQGADRSESFGLDAAGAGPGTITLNYGGGFGFDTTSDGTNEPLLTLSNPFVVNAGTGYIYSKQGGANSKYSRNVFSGPIALDGILGLDTSGAGSATRFTGTIALDRTAAGVGGIYAVPFFVRENAVIDINADSCNLDRNLEGNIVESGTGFVKPLVLRARNGGQTYIMGSANSYAGGTIVEFCGDTYRNSAQNATITVEAASKLGTGDVLVLPAGKLRLAADTNIEAGRALRMRSDRANAAVVAVRSVFVPTALAGDSAGIFAIDCTYDVPLDMSAVGNGLMFLGSVYSRQYSAATLAPCADGVYRLGGGVAGNNSRPALDVTQASLGDVGGACSLLVGQNAHNGIGEVILRKANTFSGDITVTGVKMYHDFPSVSELTGYARTEAGQSPFGAETGNVRLQSGDLCLRGVNNGQPVTKGALTFEGQCCVTVDSDYAARLTFDSLNRENNGVLLFRYVKNVGNEKIFVTNPTPAPFVTNGICRPCILCANASDFATCGVDGLAPYAGYATSLPSPGTGTEVVKWSGEVAASSDLWALRTTGALGGAGVLAIRGGGLILGGNIASTVGIDFGEAEGVIYATTGATLSGKISGSGGLTFAGQQTMLDNVDNDFTGTITINACSAGWTRTAVRFDTYAGAVHGALGHADNDILLNGGSLYRNSSGDCLLATRTITLGPLGGDLESGADVTIYGPIVGSGFLHLREGNVALDSAANTYSGGTRVRGGLTVNANSSVGTGDVTVNYGTVTFLGDDNMSAGARLTVCADVKPHTYNVEQEGRARACFQSAAPAIGSLVGSGEVRLGAAGVDTVLTVGEDDTDFAYFGKLRQFAGSTCGVTKAGSGTWTLYGAHSYTGATTVDAGSLKLCGSLAGSLAVGSAGGLTVDIGPDGATYGTVAGTVTLGGTLTVNLAEGFKPPLGESWTIIGGASGYGGSFDNISAAGFRVAVADGDLTLVRRSGGTTIFAR
jgi:autotransporter-associated beta strand protein